MLQFRDTEYALHVIENGFGNKHVSYELKKVALYYKNQGIKPKQRKEMLYDLCEKHIENFNKVKYYKAINGAMNYSNNKKNKLIDIDFVEVTEEEIGYIKSLDVDDTCKRIIFTYIVNNKLEQEVRKIAKGDEPNGEYYFENTDKRYRELIKKAGLNKPKLNSVGYEDIQAVNHRLIQEGLMADTIKSVKLLFMYDIEKTDNVVMKIEDYENIGLYYDVLIGAKGVKLCEECKYPIKVRSNRTKYCGECSLIKERENNLKRVRKHRM